ncbi:MAG: tetratricopeptide repeat protein, partial [Pseudomonadota bacterium]
LVYVLARAHMGAGDLDAAEPVLRSLVEAGTTFDQIWEDYIRVLSQNGKRAEAEAVLQEALVVVPESADLKWFQASILERNRDFEGAIVVYEELYALNDGSPIIANNLASLLSTVREDPDSLDRADRIARRLRGTDVPAFQDTYGWIRYLQGDYQEALEYLRPAADGLSTDPMVQLHLGLTYDALERTEDAIAQIARAVEMAGDDPRPAFARARDRLTELQNSDTGAGSESGGGGTLPSNSDTGVRE